MYFFNMKIMIEMYKHKIQETHKTHRTHVKHIQNACELRTKHKIEMKYTQNTCKTFSLS